MRGVCILLHCYISHMCILNCSTLSIYIMVIYTLYLALFKPVNKMTSPHRKNRLENQFNSKICFKMKLIGIFPSKRFSCQMYVQG